MHKALTPRQENTMTFLRAFFAENDQIPTVAIINKHFGWRSDHAGWTVLNQLAARRLIERNACNKYRFARTKA